MQKRYIVKPQEILMKNGLFLGTYPLKIAILGAIVAFITITIVFKLAKNKISKKDLYELKESEVIDIIESSKYNDIFNIWKNAKKVKLSKEEPKNVYYVHHGAKIRYIDPLFNGERISKCCKIANKMIENNLSYDMNNYVYLDFNF